MKHMRDSMIGLQECVQIWYSVVEWHQLLQLIVLQDVGLVTPKTMSWRTDRSSIQKEWITQECQEEVVGCSHVCIVEASRLNVLQEVLKWPPPLLPLAPCQDAHEIKGRGESVVTDSKSITSCAEWLARKSNSDEVDLTITDFVVRQHGEADVFHELR